MKKIILCLLVYSLLLVGCHNKTQPISPNNNTHHHPDEHHQ